MPSSTGRTLDLLDVGEIRNLATRRRKAVQQASLRKKGSLAKIAEDKSPLVSDEASTSFYLRLSRRRSRNVGSLLLLFFLKLKSGILLRQAS